MAFWCVSQHGEFKNTTKTFWGKSMSKTFCPKSWEKKTFFLSFFPSIFLIAFLAVSLHEELKNTIQTFSKIRPENLKKSQKRYHGTYRFCFFSSAPLDWRLPFAIWFWSWVYVYGAPEWEPLGGAWGMRAPQCHQTWADDRQDQDAHLIRIRVPGPAKKSTDPPYIC